MQIKIHSKKKNYSQISIKIHWIYIFRSVLLFIVGMIVIKFLAIFLGLLIYAAYERCDPIHAGVITRSDEVRPL